MEYNYIYVKRDIDKKINFPLILSVISILISLYTVYITNFSVVHSLKASYDLIRINQNANNLIITYRVVFQNAGNRTEGVIYSNMYLKEGIMSDYFHTRIDSSFLVQKSDAQIREYNFTFNIDSTFIYQSKSFDLVILYRLTGNKGIVILNKTELLHLRISENPLYERDPNRFKKYKLDYEDLVKDKNIELITN